MRMHEETMDVEELRWRTELRWLRARYDDEKFSPAVFAVLKMLETDISWAQHARTRH
jgi:hypothetical protein